MLWVDWKGLLLGYSSLPCSSGVKGRLWNSCRIGVVAISMGMDMDMATVSFRVGGVLWRSVGSGEEKAAAKG